MIEGKKNEVKGFARLVFEDGDFNLYLINRDVIVNRCASAFGSEKLPETILSVSITEKKVYKTIPQLGYIRAEIVPKAKQGFERQGFLTITEQIAYNQLKKMFLTVQTVNTVTGDIISSEMSMADATKEQASEFIEKSIIFITTELETYVQSAEDWKKEQEELLYEKHKTSRHGKE